MDVTIGLLADHPEALPTLIEWFEREWAPYYGNGGPGDAAADLKGSANREELPIALAAFADGALCGTAALKPESVTTHPHLSPWLAALLVAEPYRERGVGRRLVRAVEDLARRHGFDAIYTGVDPSRPLHAAGGWVLLEQVPYFVSDVAIYRKGL